MPRQTSFQMTEATERQMDDLKAAGFGSTTDIIRIAIDRMYQQERNNMKSIMYVSAWQAHTGSIGSILENARNAGDINDSDTVWAGPSGDYVIAASPADLDEDYADYSDSGTVSEFIPELDADAIDQ